MAHTVEPAYTAARVAFQRVSLFAPFYVLDAAQPFYRVLKLHYMQLFKNTWVPPSRVWLPPWPENEWRNFRSAVRRDLGVAGSRWVNRRGRRNELEA